MHDKRKTNAQLITEVQELRRRVARMEEAEESQRSQSPFRLLAETAASAIFIFQDSVFRYTNPATSKLSGYSAEELLGADIWNLVHPEHRDLIRERVEAWQRGEPVPQRSEFKILTKSGETRWIDADSTFIEFEGKPAALTIAYDITGRKLAEKALNESEQRYRKIVETAQEGIWVVDAEANSVFVNQHLAQMLGYTRDELLGRSVFDFVDAADRVEGRRYLERGRSGIKEQHDFRFRRKNGAELWTMVSTTPLFDSAGSFVGGLAMLIDITERRRSEEALRKSEERWRTYIEQANDLIFILDKAGRIVSVNNAACATTGFTAEELIGKSSLDFVVSEQRGMAASALRNRLAGVPVEQFDFEIFSKSGERICLEVRGRTQYDEDQVGGAFEIARDITERKRTEKALLESEAKFRALAQTAPSVIFILQNSKVVYANSYAETYSGYSEQELRSMDFWELVHPDHRQTTKERALARLLRESVPSRYELKLITRSGEERWVDFATGFLEFEGKPAVLATAFDITDRKRAEDALRASENRFRTLAETASDAIITIDESGRIAFVNQAAEKVFGYSRREMLDSELTKLMPEYLRHLHQAGFAQYKETGKRHMSWEAIELAGLHKNGTEIPLELSFGEFIQGDKRFVTGIARDITDRNRAEEALRKTQARLQHVLSFSPAIIYLLQIKGRKFTAEWVSESLTRVTGHERNEALAEGWWVDHIHPEDRARVVAELPRLLTGDRLTLEYRFQHKDGGYLWLHNESRLLRDQSGNPVEVVGSWVDVTERREAEVALRNSEERFRTLVGSMDDMVFTVDLDQRHTGAFGRWIGRFGLERRDMIGRTASEIFGVDAALIHEQAYARALAGEQVIYEWSMAADGQRRHFQTSLSPIRDQSGRVTGLVGVGRDSTERKRAEEALRDSQERFRRYFELGLIGMAITTPTKEYLEVNDHLCEILGYERRELLNMSWPEITHPDDLADNVIDFDRVLAGELDGYTGEKRFIRKDGRVIHAMISVKCVRCADGSVDYFVALTQDITERKEAERALRESQAHLRAILDNCPEMIFLKDLEGRYLQVNPQLERTFNLTAEQIRGRTDAEILPPELAAAFRTTDRKALKAGQALEFEESAVYMDGPHTYIVHKFPLQDASGNVYAVGGISTDITARKRAEDDLRKQKEILQKVFDHIPIMIALLDEDGSFKMVNREWERTMGWSLAEIDTQSRDIFAEFYPDPQDREDDLNFIAESSAEWADFKTRVKGGPDIDTSWANVNLSDGTTMAIGRDISERKRADDLLRRQTAQLAALHEIGLEISGESELSRVLDVATRRAAELLNADYCSVFIHDHEQAELNLVASLDHDVIGLRVKEGEGLAGRVVLSGNPQAIDDYSQWYGRISMFDDKSLGPALAAPLKWQHTVIGAISLSRTTSSDRFTNADLEFLEQIAAEVAIAVHQTTLLEEVQEGQRRLQVLSHRLIDAQEAERKRLARELHDQIGQALTAVQISLQTLQSSTHDSSTKLLEDSLAIIDEAIQQVHDLSLDLRPSMLDDLGLVAALRWYVGRVATLAGLVHGFKADGLDTRLAPEVETACFRIAQEALTNVLRHANATNVSVEITSGNSDLALLVRDNGVGFDVRTAMGRTGLSASLGLQGMQERAAAIGGSVDVKSRLRRGTKVHVTLPLKRTLS